MICSKCGNEVADGSRFCTYCAAPLETEPAVGNEPTTAGPPPAAGEPAVGSGTAGETATASPFSVDASNPLATPPPPSSGTPLSPGAIPPPPPPGTPPPPGAMPYSGQTAPYVVATPIPPAFEPKKSKAPLVIGIVVGVILLCCIGCVVVAWLLYGAAEDAVSGYTSGTDDYYATPAPPPTTIYVVPPAHDTNPDNQQPPSRPAEIIGQMNNPKVVVDNDTVKVTIDAGTRIVSDAGNFIDVSCVVENKTDQTIALYFEDSTLVDGYKGGQIVFDKDYLASEYGEKPHFLPGEAAPAALAFDREKITGDLKGLKGSLLVYNAESLDDIASYYIEIPEF